VQIGAPHRPLSADTNSPDVLQGDRRLQHLPCLGLAVALYFRAGTAHGESIELAAREEKAGKGDEPAGSTNGQPALPRSLPQRLTPRRHASAGGAYLGASWREDARERFS